MENLSAAIQTACLWEVSARKAGNVHRFADFADLTFTDFTLSAAAITPVLRAHQNAPLGITILEAIRATRQVVNTNTNLGIVLLLAALSKCEPGHWRTDLLALIASTTINDAEHVYEAIRLAIPGGLGKVENQDIAETPTQTLRDVMALAADRDMIARQYSTCFHEVLEDGVPALLHGGQRFGSVEAAILHLQVHLLSRYPDSLIARKCGDEVAANVMAVARAIDLSTADGIHRLAELDRWLRADGHARNPGTTADLVTACLFVALREHRMELSMPFSWDCYG